MSRVICYQCHRPMTSCMCQYITPIKTQTQFVLLMHPKEFRKTKNGTGHFTHLSLTNCTLHIGINFTENPQVNALINDPNNNCYVLYPSALSTNLNKEPISQEGKQTVLFLIDATWPCSRAMLTSSPNLDALPKVSFTHQASSAFQFKKQPHAYCLSTIESTLCILKLLNLHHAEKIPQSALENFLKPFERMVEYQLNCHN